MQEQAVCFTGGMWGMSRDEAISLVREHGSSYSRYPTPSTTLVVVGTKRPALTPEGQLSRKLRLAQAIESRRQSVRIIGEQAFCEIFGVADRLAVRDSYTARELSCFAGVSVTQVDRWTRAGLLLPRTGPGRERLYSMSQLQLARSLDSRLKERSWLKHLVRALCRLSRWSEGGANDPPSLFFDGPRCYLDTDENGVVDTRGQLMMGFMSEARTLANLDIVACDAESAGFHAVAIEAYQQICELDRDDADAFYNLGNAHLRVGALDLAALDYQRATEICPGHLEATCNLGWVLLEQGDEHRASEAFRKVLDLDSSNVDAHYHLACIFDEQGDDSSAAHHWQRYLRLDTGTEYSTYARSRLVDLSGFSVANPAVGSEASHASSACRAPGALLLN